jgi:hypothetical protein
VPRQRENLLSCAPDIITYTPYLQDDFIVIASDGLWDVMSSSDVIAKVQCFLIDSGIYTAVLGMSLKYKYVSFGSVTLVAGAQFPMQKAVSREIREKLKDYAYQLARYATKQLQSRDNITIMIVLFAKLSPYCLDKPVQVQGTPLETILDASTGVADEVQVGGEELSVDDVTAEHVDQD